MDSSGGFQAVERAVRVDEYGVRIGEVTVVAPDGSRRRRTYLHSPEVVAIVAVVDDDILLVREFRPAVGSLVLALPMGKITGSVDAAATAELAEETGFAAGRIEQIATLLSCPGWMDQTMRVVRAWDCVPLGGRAISDDPDDVEEAWSSVVRTPLTGLAEAIAGGDLRDARSIAAIHLALGSLG
ncbi:MAG TPA: NUDIX domain-containing protein [Micromonosporaceae bacterium]